MTDVKLEAWLKQGFELYKQNVGLLVLASVIALAVSVLSLGLLGGPMAAGFLWIVFRLQDSASPAPQATDVFKGFDVFVPAFVFGLLFGGANLLIHILLDFIPLLGWIASIAASTALSALVLFALPLIVEQRMDFMQAIQRSVDVVQPRLLPFMLFAFVAGLAGGIGVLACGVGIVATMPIAYCAVAVAYRDCVGATGASEAPTPPASPM